jgi:YHS domain-containing protein
MVKVAVVMLLVLGMSYPVFADGYGQETAVVAAETLKELVQVGNKICPVGGERVDGMGEVVTYEYNGKVYNLCCAMCAKDFKKDPEKYSKIAEEEVAAVQKAGS